MRSTVLAALSAAAGVVYALGAGASEPGKPVDPAMFSGRWYQLGRMGADAPRPCPAATEDFASGGRGVNVTVICHPAGGGGDTYHGRLAIIPGSADAKFKLQFFGGLVSREYWTMNHAGEWALTMTPGGRTLYLMARHPALAASERAAAVAAIRALGFDPAGMRP